MAQPTDVSPIVGEYENFLYGGAEKNHYHYVSIIADESTKNGYIWRTLCNEWTLTPIADEKLECAVGDQCPYFKDGHQTMRFKTDHKGTIIGAFGPGDEYFTKVEQHSALKYALKGVDQPISDAEEKEGANDEKTDAGDVDDELSASSSATSLEWSGGKCVKGQCVGRVTIDENFVVSFDLTVHGKNSEGWESILHVGHANMERSPGFWLHPKSCRLHVRLSDTASNNSGYDPTLELEMGRRYRIRLQAKNNDVSFFVDGKLQTFRANVWHATRFKNTVFVADPWHVAANATVSDLKIYAPK